MNCIEEISYLKITGKRKEQDPNAILFQKKDITLFQSMLYRAKYLCYCMYFLYPVGLSLSTSAQKRTLYQLYNGRPSGVHLCRLDLFCWLCK